MDRTGRPGADRGSEAIRQDDDKFLAAGGVLDRLVEVKEAELEKL